MLLCHFNRACHLDKLGVYMDPAAHRIHDAMQTVALLRQHRAADPKLNAACLEVKRFQAQRFRATYADLLQSTRYQSAANFFNDELYGDHDYTQRDQQFARIANTIARIFPATVVETAASLAEVHAMTEKLDDLVARQWLATLQGSPARRYISCWRVVADRSARLRQLEVVLHLGQQLDRLTRTRGLRTLLRMMRAPAHAGGLNALQNFLETGFDAFAKMGGATEFLNLIESREAHWIALLFDEDAVACETQLNQLLAQTPAH
jgi:hypothetical protein